MAAPRRGAGPVRAAWVVALTLGLLAGCGSGTSRAGDGDGRDGGLPTSSGCADLVVIGARGSTQDPDRNLGVGTEVRRTVEQLARLVDRRHGWTVRVDAVRYDASATATLDDYVAHTAAGARTMTRRLASVERRCPGSRVALVGFSQGAQVVHAAAADLPARLAPRVALVAMIADPRRNPSDRIAHWTYDLGPADRGGRLGAGTAVAAGVRDVTISLCHPDDEICNARGAPGSAPSQVHRHFYETPEHAAASARHMATILHP